MNVAWSVGSNIGEKTAQKIHLGMGGSAEKTYAPKYGMMCPNFGHEGQGSFPAICVQKSPPQFLMLAHIFTIFETPEGLRFSNAILTSLKWSDWNFTESFCITTTSTTHSKL